MNQDTIIWVKFTQHGIHRYPDAPEEVSYLQNPHRHLFHFKVTAQVFHDNRDIEFHMLQNWCKSLYQGELQVDYKSCEMLARELLEALKARYGEIFLQVEVSEDDECGAVVTYDPSKKPHPNDISHRTSFLTGSH